jgi:serine/threonine protein kinase
MDFSSYDSSYNPQASAWSVVASALPSVFDSAAISDALIQESDLLKASEAYSLPMVDVDLDADPDFQPTFLGSGASYRAYLRKFSQWEKLVAIKHIKSKVSPGSVENVPSLGNQRLLVLREIHSLCQFNSNPNIVNLLGWGQHSLEGEYQAFLVTDYAPLGSLDSFLQGSGRCLKSEHLFRICADIAEGLHAIHSKRMVHGDVKAANILIFEDESCRGQFTAKINDLGFSISLDFDEGDACYRGTDLFNAPEIRGEGSRRLRDFNVLACDVYSLGLLIWTVFKQGKFFLHGVSTAASGGDSEEHILDSVGPLKLLEYALVFAWARESGEEAQTLSEVLSACLQIEPAARLPIDCICKKLTASIPLRA